MSTHYSSLKTAEARAGDSAMRKQSAELVTGFGFAPVGVGSRRDGGKLTQLDGPLMALNALTQDQRRLHACQCRAEAGVIDLPGLR